MSGNGAPATVVPWPGNYDVEGVPPARFTPGKAPETPLFNVAGAGPEDSNRLLVRLYEAGGRVVEFYDGLGNDRPRSAFYDSTGRRKQFYWADGTPASNYWPDGTQIPLYEYWQRKITDGVRDPLWREPEPEPEPDPPVDPVDPEPEPGPGPSASLVTVEELQAFMPDDLIPDDLATLSVEAATAVVAAYCRDRHVDRAGWPRAGVKAVVLTVAARIAANPSGISRQDTAGSFSTRRSGGFNGFTLAETTILNRYRKRAIGP